jgi:hypothetical protein
MTVESKHICDGCGADKRGFDPIDPDGWVRIETSSIRGTWSRIRHLCPGCHSRFREDMPEVLES